MYGASFERLGRGADRFRQRRWRGHIRCRRSRASAGIAPRTCTRLPTADASGTLFEYWGHEASLLPVDLQPLLRWRMARAARGEGIYAAIARFGRERAGTCRTSAARDRRTWTDVGRRAVASAQGRRRLVGLVGRKARGRMAVLVRRGDDGDAARHLRTRVRADRAGAAAIRTGGADADEGRRAARAAAHFRPMHGCRHRALPARLFPSASRRCEAAHRRAGRGRRSRSDSVEGWDDVAYLSRDARGRGAWRRRRCWHRSIR